MPKRDARARPPALGCCAGSPFHHSQWELTDFLALHAEMEDVSARSKAHRRALRELAGRIRAAAEGRATESAVGGGEVDGGVAGAGTSGGGGVGGVSGVSGVSLTSQAAPAAVGAPADELLRRRHGRVEP